MSPMLFTKEKDLSLLAIGAHPDDIELGGGGLIHRLRSELDARVRLLVLTHGLKSWQSAEDFDREQRHEESLKAAGVLGIDESDVSILGYEDCGLHGDLHSLIREVEGLIASERFDMVLTHAEGDTHKDHETVYGATISATRDFHGTVLLYQAPSTILNEFRPTLFVDLMRGNFEAKQRALQEHVSQREKSFMAEERVRRIAQSWSAFLNTPPRLFEAFQVYKSFWSC
jgi:LmbE family N-acetylglucosaminyl deacetylase